MAGYSGTPLAKKLGIKADHRVALVNAPAGFESILDGLPADAIVTREFRSQTSFDVIVMFTKELLQLRRSFGVCRKRLASTGGLWIAWPKKASGIGTDLSDGAVRAVGLGGGLVDNKVCAIDDIWSGLRFVVRLKDRPSTR